ncbi:hypothetical protein [Streptomyces himalayensis]|uniref:Sigma-like protein n=1 Tax=Streptomyces himalayensis subsp. himalayensis TaxID=2756131 RepID=A0A7W0DLD4_9ACTN|nr:hypothetical protein [Streptomyces himalayensis]MBA2947110.1 hypothetical protein [Streptomyces himalayensis subsp. himalayensis]
MSEKKVVEVKPLDEHMTGGSEDGDVKPLDEHMTGGTEDGDVKPLDEHMTTEPSN